MGFAFNLFNGDIIYCRKGKPVPTASFKEVEQMATSQATTKEVWWKKLFSEIMLAQNPNDYMWAKFNYLANHHF